MTTSDERIMRYTAEELDEMVRRGETLTDWDRVRSLTDEEIEASIDVEDEGEFDHSRYYAGPFSLELMDDPANWRENVPVAADVVDWFRERYPDDFQDRVVTVLRDYVKAEQRKTS